MLADITGSINENLLPRIEYLLEKTQPSVHCRLHSLY